jgi:phosphopantothenoylcysteine decarboxylase/phosphopantothenate--cysteine ligase
MSRSLEGKTILLGLSGGIACYKSAELARLLVRDGADVHCLMTRAAQKFVTPLTLQSLTGNAVATNVFDLSQETQIGHIRLADRADLYIVAPATANLIARLAQGFADDIVTTVALATRAPLVLAPSMNVNMYEHPAVQANLATLRQRGVRVVDPGEGELACGWRGKGRLAEPPVLLAEAKRALSVQDFAGVRVLVTAGPTREALDSVRFLSNRSSGKMGYSLAEAAWQRGADVTLVSGPTSLALPHGVEHVPVCSAEEMKQAVFAAFPESSVVIMCAAVADYRPAHRFSGKIKKKDATMTLELVRTPDILAELGARKGKRILVGFAAEAEHVERYAREKLEKKHLDLIVANDISQAQAGFESDTNAAVLLDRFGNRVELGLMPKTDMAHSILDHIARLRRGE